MREPTIEEVRAAAASGAGDMATVRAANGYLRLRFGWTCDERDTLRALVARIVASYTEGAGDRDGTTVVYLSSDLMAEARAAAGEAP